MIFFSIDAEETCGHLCQMVNDAPDSTRNSVMKLKVFSKSEHLCLFAVKDIQAGQEILYSYGERENV
jgi:SET domain-containing protein